MDIAFDIQHHYVILRMKGWGFRDSIDEEVFALEAQKPELDPQNQV